MDDKTAHLADQLRRNPAMLKSLMQSQDGQMLMQMLTQGDRGASLQRAVQSAARGDTTAITQMDSQIMQSPSGAEVVERINKAVQK